MPPGLRKRLVVRVARWMVRSTYGATSVTVRWRKWRGALALHGSLFCEVRDKVDHPLCEFYAAAFRRLMTLFQLEADVVTEQCHASGASHCAMALTMRPAAGSR
jgi:predicted hydrocarbon binding protein